MGKGNYHTIKDKGFDKNPQNINRTGANRRLISAINLEMKQQGYEETNNKEIISAYLTLLNLPISKIKEISNVKNDNFPMLYKLVAKEMLGKRGLDMLEKLLDRAVGKAQQKLDLTTGGEKLTPEIYKLPDGTIINFQA